ncbi:hypothetical protein CK203_051931 [Vitis vinifera]|uniref:Retrotransposon gag domain-containing protein n=1 Tax=Vitis vinifera TaxID=29760 RepID=A0A438GTL8_VITVI|nr:hypothetical protein CK203_051931 [Vitis vinifera]
MFLMARRFPSPVCILTGDAKLWWQTRMEDDAESGRPQITTWETLKKELKDQFLLKKTQAHRICEGICQGVQFLDAGY